MTPRIPPIPFRDWPSEILAMIPGFSHDGAPPSEKTQKAKNMIGTLAHNPALAKVSLPFSGHLLRATTLTERQRELLVLRVAVVRKSPYTWAEHVPMARKAGIGDEEIARIAYGPDAPFWEPFEAAVLRSVDELVAEGMISGDTWAVLAEKLAPGELLDLIFTVGAYQMLGGMIRSFALDLDDDLLPS